MSTDPAEGAVLPAAPDQVRLTFNEAVAGVPDGVELYDARGTTVASSSAVSGDELTVTLDEPVGEGTLVLVWRVVSEDGHPVSGSLSFSIGAPSASVETPPNGADASTDAPLLLTLARWVGYAGLLLAVGLVAFTVLFLPTSHLADAARQRLVAATRAAAAVAVVGWLVALPLAAVYQLGGGLSAVSKGTTWSALATGEYVVTAAVVIGVVSAVCLLGRGAPARPRAIAALMAAATATCAPALIGHTRAATPEALVVAADMLHLLAGSVWLGGLAALTLVLSDLAGRGALGAEVLARFSAVAAGLLMALVATGTLMAWRIVGSWSALLDSAYGQLLLVKILVALVAVGFAAWNRFGLLPRFKEASRRRDRRAGAHVLVRAVAAEAVALIAVLLVTGLLVDKSPEAEASDTASAGSAPVVRTGTLGDVEVRATVSAPTTGPSTVTVEMLDPAGEPFEGMAAPRVRLSSDQVDLGAVPVKSVAPGTYAAEVVFPSPGTWHLQVSLRISEFDNPVTSLDFGITAR
ncbi:CopD family protein [Nocardioides bizhenqiangii]|uniref:CopD family protein n=1 Tax=Nocardioides bizhenqiangii TaxID=3095076 RepID=A0ABZ0ZMA6_9ACTN|nr:CopD family protein [Nocardioides sp. HM61]WQQ25338.1 CopD family protein [Nocardioides sp. HM61]